jgi:hypothetical protein
MKADIIRKLILWCYATKEYCLCSISIKEYMIALKYYIAVCACDGALFEKRTPGYKMEPLYIIV